MTDNYDFKNITSDLSGNKYLKKNNGESDIIDTFENMKQKKNKDSLIELEKIIMINKKQLNELNKFENEIIPRLNNRCTDFENEKNELLYENSLLRQRLTQLDYNILNSDRSNIKDRFKKNSSTTDSSIIIDDDHLISSSRKECDITSLDPFNLFTELIILFNEIKNILKKLSNDTKEYQHSININEQESDDLLFYKSIILDSKKFFITSHKIRKNKLVFDLNQILKMFNYPYIPSISEINKTTKSIFKKYYVKLSKEVKCNNDYINKPIWIKNNKLKYIETIKREMNRTLLYHLEINTYYRTCIINEINFFKIK